MLRSLVPITSHPHSEEALGLYEHSLDHDDDRIASLQYEMGVSTGIFLDILLIFPYFYSCT